MKPKPAGSWNCSMNIAVDELEVSGASKEFDCYAFQILSAIRLLMSEPNLG
ncbi:unnamed protein product, partial [Allacma fusca]